MLRKKDPMAYKPSTDTTQIESLWREQQAVTDKRSRFILKDAEKIRYQLSRGMSRGALEKIYGREAVGMAIGCPIVE